MPRIRLRLLTLLLALAFLALPHDARAGNNDKDVEDLIQGVFEVEYLNSNFKDALDKLELAKQACEGKEACSPKVRAHVFIAIGTVLAGGFKKTAEAKAAFVTALQEDPTATPKGDFITPEVQEAFNQARGVASSSTGSGAATDQNKPTESAPKPKKECTGGRAPRGWKNGAAYCYFAYAAESQKKREWPDCVAYAQASIALENRATTRYLAAQCEEKAGLWIEALGDYQIVADTAGKMNLFETATAAKASAQTLRDKIPKVVIRKPAKAEGLVVKMNDVEVPPEKLGGEIWINPGQRSITATGKVDGVEGEFEQVIQAAEFETATVDIKLGPKGVKAADRAVMRCILEAKTKEDFAKCINGGKTSSNLTFHVAGELSGYHDSDHVDVVTPALSGGVESPTAGWGVGGSFLVDVVTAASVDILANASPRWTEIRYVPAINGHKKLGEYDVSGHASASIEPDYLALGAGFGVSTDLRDKTVTPAIAIDYGHDISGRAGTPFKTYGNLIDRVGIDLSSSFVINKSTLVGGDLTGVIEVGDTSKPYRYIPMFSPTIAPFVPVGASIQLVNAVRNPERPLEQLPTNRQRWAIAGRIAHRFTTSTFRMEERLYADSWGLKASTTDMKYLVDLSKSLRVWPHLRFHGQSGASFWQLAYVSTYSTEGLKLPPLRTGDHELGPLIGVTLGGGARLAFGDKKQYGLTFTADVAYTRFLDHLYILQRFGYFGATALEVEIE